MVKAARAAMSHGEHLYTGRLRRLSVSPARPGSNWSIRSVAIASIAEDVCKSKHNCCHSPFAEQTLSNWNLSLNCFDCAGLCHVCEHRRIVVEHLADARTGRTRSTSAPWAARSSPAHALTARPRPTVSCTASAMQGLIAPAIEACPTVKATSPVLQGVRLAVDAAKRRERSEMR